MTWKGRSKMAAGSYEGLEERVDGLEERVDLHDSRLAVMETSLADMRSECATGFKDIKTDLGRIYEERAKWSAWARENIGHALKWAGVIILTACGITQASTIINSVAKAFEAFGH